MHTYLCKDSKPKPDMCKLFSRFSAADLPCIRITSAVITEVKAKLANEQIKMGKFHCGAPELEKSEHSFLNILKSPEHPKEMMAVVHQGNKDASLLVFGRMGLTNFAYSPLELVDGIPVSCSEQLFKLHCMTMHMGISDNCDEVAINILCALEPFKAKTATGKLANFNKVLWDAKSKAAMYASILRICMEEATFARFKRYAALLTGSRLLIVEANDDKIWGINMYTSAFLQALLEKMTPESDLFEEAKALFDGTNELGDVLTTFFEEIRDMSFEDYLKAVSVVQFVEIIDV